MLTGGLTNQIDRIWDAFWSGASPTRSRSSSRLPIRSFCAGLDDLHTLEENKSARLKRPMDRRIFRQGKDPRGRPYDDLRWSRFKHFAPAEMFTVVDQHAFPFLRKEATRVLRTREPIVAAVQGAAIGGDLGLAAYFRVTCSEAGVQRQLQPPRVPSRLQPHLHPAPPRRTAEGQYALSYGRRVTGDEALATEIAQSGPLATARRCGAASPTPPGGPRSGS